jgi:hypothetical protein
MHRAAESKDVLLFDRSHDLLTTELIALSPLPIPRVSKLCLQCKGWRSALCSMRESRDENTTAWEELQRQDLGAKDKSGQFGRVKCWGLSPFLSKRPFGAQARLSGEGRVVLHQLLDENGRALGPGEQIGLVLAPPQWGCIGVDLLANDRHICDRHGWDAEEDHDADAEKVAEEL